MTLNNPPTIYCSDLSAQAGEPLIGSATPTTVYLLLEYNKAWGTKALDESDLPETVKRHINAFVKSNPNAKCLLIHNPKTAREHGVRFFLASAVEGGQMLYTFLLEDYAGLLELDFAKIVDDPGSFQAYRQEQPLLLVCCNGRRDVCCARKGIQVYNALESATADYPGLTVYQCTHLGGHRFAANLIVLPHGLLYGRVDPASALQILEATRADQAYLPNLRGRTAYPPAAQIGDWYLRGETGEDALDAYRLHEVRPFDEKTWTVDFRRQGSGDIHLLQVRIEQTQHSVYESCQLDKTTPLVRYSVTRL
jgi:hypothetical protein